MQFTLIFFGPSSFAALLVIPTTACLEAQYAKFCGAPMRPRILAALTMELPSFICGT
jgi:hypothetical protein